MEDQHFKNGISSIDPSGENQLQEGFTFNFLFFLFNFNFNYLQEFLDLFIVTFNDGSGQFDNWVHDEGTESSWEGFTGVSGVVVFPLLCL